MFNKIANRENKRKLLQLTLSVFASIATIVSLFFIHQMNLNNLGSSLPYIAFIFCITTLIIYAELEILFNAIDGIFFTD